ncbi:hypothetical protein O181_057017 [Austropuccinia psidii MF-1]|uniref:Uncharacterized protein n=1 Tax=Austropuccinia psidii MF-1 TaxID=1389203 RepID=A0A9Q3HV08_9BASI|nr:hypothetical protein [Austropuccinia psidii MF-1]
MPKQISIVPSNGDTYKEKFVTNQLCEAHVNQTLSSKMRQELIDVLYTYKDVPYPPVLRRPAYPADPRAKESLEKNIQELIQLDLLRKVGHNEEVEVTTPVIISCHNDESEVVGDVRELNTYTVPDRYPIPRIQ